MTRLGRGCLASALVAVVLLACGDDDGSGSGSDAGTPAVDEQSATIGTDGGELSIEGASVEVPEGALGEDKELNVERLSASAARAFVERLPDGLDAASDVLLLTPHGSQFDEPVTVTLAYRGDAEGLSVMRLDDEDDTSWENVAGAEIGDGEVSFETTRFSLIVVAREGAVPARSDAGVSSDAGGTQPSAGSGGEGGKPANGGSGSTVDGDFEITVMDAIEIAQGATGRLDVVAMRAAGFSDPIDVTVEGLPEGVTAQDTQIVGADDGTLVELTVAASAAAGTTELTVRASAGATERTATAELTVTGPPKTFMFGVSPYQLTIARGGSAETTLTLTPVNGFEGTVDVSFTIVDGVTVEPTSVECQGSEPTVQVLTLSAADDAPLGMQNAMLQFDSEESDETSGGIGIGITIQ